MSARSASSPSRAATIRCSVTSGRASPRAVTIVQIGQNVTEQIGELP